MSLFLPAILPVLRWRHLGGTYPHRVIVHVKQLSFLNVDALFDAHTSTVLYLITHASCIKRQSANFVYCPVLMKWELARSAATRSNTLPWLGLLAREELDLACWWPRSVFITLKRCFGEREFPPVVMRAPLGWSPHSTPLLWDAFRASAQTGHLGGGCPEVAFRLSAR